MYVTHIAAGLYTAARCLSVGEPVLAAAAEYIVCSSTLQHVSMPDSDHISNVIIIIIATTQASALIT